MDDFENDIKKFFKNLTSSHDEMQIDYYEELIDFMLKYSTKEQIINFLCNQQKELLNILIRK